MARTLSITMDQAINYRSKYEINVSTKPLTTKTKSGYSKRSKISKSVVNILMILAVLLGGVSISAPRAEANMFTDLLNEGCKTMNFTLGGSDIALPRTAIDPALPPEGVKATGEEVFGYNLLFSGWVGPWNNDKASQVIKDGKYKDDNEGFSGSSSSCVKTTATASTLAANTAFSFTRIVVWFINASLSMSLDDQIANPLVRAIAFQVITGNPEGTISGSSGAVLDGGKTTLGLRDVLFIDYMLPAIMLYALGLGVRGFVQRRFSEVIPSVCQILLVATSGFLVLGNPAWTFNTYDTFVKEHGTGIMLNIANGARPVDGEGNNLCTTDAGTGPAQQNSIREFRCIIWESLLWKPWVEGQFGSEERKGFVETSVMLGTVPASPNSDAYAQAYAQQQRDGVSDAKLMDMKLKVAMSQVFNPSAGKEGSGSVNRIWTGEDFNSRMMPVVASLVLSVIMAVFIVPICFMLVFLGIMFKLMFMFSPIHFTYGLINSRPLVDLLRRMVGNMIQHFSYTMLLGVVLFVISTVFFMGLNVWELIMAAIVLALGFIKMLPELAKINPFAFINTSGDSPEANRYATQAKGAVLGAAAGSFAAIKNNVFGSRSSSNSGGGIKMAQKRVSPESFSTDAKNESKEHTGATNTKSSGGQGKTSRAEVNFEDTMRTEPADTATVSKANGTSRADSPFTGEAKPSDADAKKNGSVAVAERVRAEGAAKDGLVSSRAETPRPVSSPVVMPAGAKGDSVSNPGKPEVSTNGTPRVDKPVAPTATRTEKEREDALRDIKSPSADKKPGLPSKRNEGALPKRSEGALPKRSEGGSPRAGK